MPIAALALLVLSGVIFLFVVMTDDRIVSDTVAREDVLRVQDSVLEELRRHSASGESSADMVEWLRSSQGDGRRGVKVLDPLSGTEDTLLLGSWVRYHDATFNTTQVEVACARVTLHPVSAEEVVCPPEFSELVRR